LQHDFSEENKAGRLEGRKKPRHIHNNHSV
jgi:hypothetical protein